MKKEVLSMCLALRPASDVIHLVAAEVEKY